MVVFSWSAGLLIGPCITEFCIGNTFGYTLMLRSVMSCCNRTSIQSQAVVIDTRLIQMPGPTDPPLLFKQSCVVSISNLRVCFRISSIVNAIGDSTANQIIG